MFVLGSAVTITSCKQHHPNRYTQTSRNNRSVNLHFCLFQKMDW